MKNNFQLATLLLVALVMFSVTLYWFRPVPDRLTRVTVAGEAESKVAPDTAIITFSVVTQNNQAVTAQQENARKSEAVKQSVQAITANAESEIKTADYSLQPEQDYGGKMPRIVGYVSAFSEPETATYEINLDFHNFDFCRFDAFQYQSSRFTCWARNADQTDTANRND